MFSIVCRKSSNHNLNKWIVLNFLLKLSDLKSDLTLLLGCLNPALNNLALTSREEMKPSPPHSQKKKKEEALQGKVIPSHPFLSEVFIHMNGFQIPFKFCYTYIHRVEFPRLVRECKCNYWIYHLSNPPIKSW